MKIPHSGELWWFDWGFKDPQNENKWAPGLCLIIGLSATSYNIYDVYWLYNSDFPDDRSLFVGHVRASNFEEFGTLLEGDTPCPEM